VNMPLDEEMTVQEMLDHLEEIKTRQKTVHQDAAVRMVIGIIQHLVICQWCDGTGTIMTPDTDKESAYETACPNPLHDIANGR
jgi:hypothetical protein